MIKDITIGQYFPGDSVLHKLDPRFKLVLTVAILVILFSASNYLSLLVGAMFVAFIMLISKIPLKIMLKSLKPILPLVLFTAVLNLFFVTGTEPIFAWRFIKIYPEGIEMTVFMAVRIIFLIMGTSLLTYTTSPVVLTDALERLFAPLKVIKFPVHELAMMMTIALRFIPTLIEETDKIMSAQKARGADIESGGLVKRIKALIPILIPLFISSFKRAEELALAMESRCYRGGEGRTRMKQLKAKARDYIAVLVCLVVLSLVITLNILI